MKNKKIMIILVIFLLVVIVFLSLFLFNNKKYNPTPSQISLCDLNKSYHAPYSFSSASGPKIDYSCNCPTNSYIMRISPYSGMNVVLGNNGDKKIEYQCVKDFKVCPESYKLTSYLDNGKEFTCTKK